ncbi:MAG TPA: ribonuclease HII [Candidatus Saccharimonadales bacterium]
MILGIDEVGRGPWAGPLVVGAVVLGEEKIEGLTDSKKLTAKRREALNQEIIEKAAGVGLGWVYAYEIDEIGLSAALVEATKRAVSQVKVPYHEIIIDGTINFLKDTGKGSYVTTMKKADLLISSVSAASIVAKVARDEYMRLQSEVYSEYGFDSHVGYGTAAHKAAIERHGITPLHRLSFSPLQKYVGTRSSRILEDSQSSTADTTRDIGDSGENVVAKELVRRGFEIIARNWKTKLCEIDIVARKDDAIYFVEVKHRKTADQGGGVAAVTSKKLRQMEFAARLYLHFEHLYDIDARIAVATTNSNPVAFESFLVLE